MSVQLAFFSGLGERDRILSAMRENHSVYLNAIRSFARVIALKRGTVTIDDVREEIERQNFPMPSEIGADERVFGAVFSRSEFLPVGQCPTRRAEHAKRVGIARSNITVYKLKNEEPSRGNATA